MRGHNKANQAINVLHNPYKPMGPNQVSGENKARTPKDG
jgi:hypothetical protein